MLTNICLHVILTVSNKCFYFLCDFSDYLSNLLTVTGFSSKSCEIPEFLQLNIEKKRTSRAKDPIAKKAWVEMSSYRQEDDMNKQKLDAYNVKASIHTAQAKSPDEVVEEVQETVQDCIKVSRTNTAAGLTTNIVLNPNKLNGDCFAFSEFQTVVDTILAGAGIKNYQFVRTDMRFDSYDPAHYERYAKLNRYLISGLAAVYKVRNTYKTTDLFTSKQLSVAVKNDYFECENYDRAAKSEVTHNTVEPAQSRLEVRTVARQWRKINEKPGNNMEKLKNDMTTTWFSRWNKVVDNLDLVHERYNNALEEIYKNGKSAYPVKFRSLTDFLIQYQNCIFCKAQLIDLLSRFPDEVKDPKVRAQNFRKKYGVEFFSKQDVRRAIDEVQRAALEFFEN